MTAEVSSWGRLGKSTHDLLPLFDDQLLPLSLNKSGLAFGNGRSYGDVCLNPDGVLWTTSRLDRFIAFDPASGMLSCEAGVLLRDIQKMALPFGWMLPVTPGTQLITIG